MIGYSPYRKKRSNFLPVIIVLLAVFISFSAFRGLFGVRTLLQAALYPFQYAALSVWKGVTGVPSAITSQRSLLKENAALKDELDELRPRLLVTDELVRENQRLRGALSFMGGNPYRFRMLAAQVIGRSPDPYFSVLQIGQGSRAGVRKDMPVIVADGLVGRVVEVSRYSAKVMLITDAESSVAAVDARSRDFGVVDGISPLRLYMRHVDAGGDVANGDVVVTSNISTIFPPGIPIGIVSRASKKEHDLFYHIEIKPSVDFSRIEEVFVVF